MYKVNKFILDDFQDGKLNFSMVFGVSTAERLESPNGWTVTFNNLALNPEGGYEGTIYEISSPRVASDSSPLFMHVKDPNGNICSII